MTKEPDRTIVPGIRQIEARHLPEVERELLPNGVELVVLDSGVQPVSRITFGWAAGSVDVDDCAAYNLMCQMLTEGSVHHSGAEISDIFETCGAWVNVEPGQHATLLNIYMLNHTADEILPLACEIIDCASFPDDTLMPLKEKRASAAELSLKKVKTLAQINSNALAFGEKHPRNRFVRGDEYRKVVRDDIISMYGKLIKGMAPKVYLSGQIDAGLRERVKHMAASICFGQGGVARRIMEPDFAVGGAVRHTPVGGSLQTALRITIPVIPLGHPDYQLLRVTVFALGGYFGSRLMSVIREEKGYTYGISAVLTPYMEGSFVTISCETDNKYVESVKSEIACEIRRLATEPPTEQELQIIRNTMMSQIAGMFDAPFSVMDHWIFIDSFGPQANNTAARMELLHTITSEQIAATALKYLVDAPWLVASAGGDTVQCDGTGSKSGGK